MSATKSFDRVLGHVPSGIFILTVGTGTRATGMLASWVMQAGFEPPMVSVAVKLGRYVCDWLTEGQPFVLNLVARRAEGAVETLSTRVSSRASRRSKGWRSRTVPAACRFLKDSLGHLECEPAGHVDSGDHRIFLAKVVRGKMNDGDGTADGAHPQQRGAVLS